jgi:NADH-quinone oxidoreductase subunit L
MYYSRVRTAQAASRAFAISRFSDYCLYLLFVEIMATFKTDSIATISFLANSIQFDLSTIGSYFFDISSLDIIVFLIFLAAACKSAQFLLFVWLPDAMEAPTPASALIHSSTLVVLGIFLIFKFSAILHLSYSALTIFSILGSLTVLYGAIYSIQTSDLKKAVAYSTISQIGYLFCGCSLLAFKEVLLYLLMHAVCKAMLFVFVGYIVHTCNGVTSLKRMGGLFVLLPDIAIYMFILCIILAGAPYTIGFFIKELLIYHIFSCTGYFTYIIYFC